MCTLEAAVNYAQCGVFVFPAAAVAKKSHKCAARSNGQPWGASNDPAQVRRDFAHWAGARIGIPTGIVNGFIVIEVDTIEGHGVDGATSLQKLEAKYGALPVTRQAISPSGSVHRYFRHPGNIKIRNSAGELGEGIDVRGDGGMVITPPSVNPDGRAYTWLNREPLAPMPGWLVELTREKPRTISQRAVAAIKGPLGPLDGSSGYGAAALESEITALINTAPGGRNHQLNRASFSLHQLVAGGELNGHEVHGRLVDGAIANGLVADDGLPSVMATIESGRRAGLQHPRSRPAS
jgi:hypothetical protein